MGQDFPSFNNYKLKEDNARRIMFDGKTTGPDLVTPNPLAFRATTMWKVCGTTPTTKEIKDFGEQSGTYGLAPSSTQDLTTLKTMKLLRKKMKIWVLILFPSALSGQLRGIRLKAKIILGVPCSTTTRRRCKTLNVLFN